MESTPSGSDRGAASAIDAAADLDLLNRSKAVIDLDQFLDFGPWWYAPFLATMIGGLTRFGQAFSGVGNIFALVIAAAAGGAVSLHDYRRRPVRARRTLRSFGYLLAIVVISWIIIGAWGTAASSMGYESFFPGWAAVAWLLTTAVLLATRSLLLVLRKRQAPLS